MFNRMLKHSIFLLNLHYANFPFLYSQEPTTASIYQNLALRNGQIIKKTSKYISLMTVKERQKSWCEPEKATRREFVQK